MNVTFRFYIHVDVFVCMSVSVCPSLFDSGFVFGDASVNEYPSHLLSLIYFLCFCFCLYFSGFFFSVCLSVLLFVSLSVFFSVSLNSIDLSFTSPSPPSLSSLCLRFCRLCNSLSMPYPFRSIFVFVYVCILRNGKGYLKLLILACLVLCFFSLLSIASNSSLTLDSFGSWAYSIYLFFSVLFSSASFLSARLFSFLLFRLLTRRYNPWR